MDWYFFVSKESEMLSGILMVDGMGQPLIAKWGVHDDANPPSGYWELCSGDDIEDLLSGEYDMFLFDQSTLSEESVDVDPDKEIEWQIDFVQRWARGLGTSLAMVEAVSDKFPDISAVHPNLFVNGQASQLLRSTASAPKPQVTVRKSHRCPWCAAGLERRYNFNIDWFDDYDHVPEIERPIIWSDGLWGSRDSEPFRAEMQNHFGDSVLNCPVCEASFLASHVEMNSGKSSSTGVLYAGFSDSIILPGKCASQANVALETDQWLGEASIPATATYLAACQVQGLISWEEWTAAQQLLLKVGNEVRSRILANQNANFEDEAKYKELLRVFLSRIGQIKDGTLGDLGPFLAHSDLKRDENFFVHTYLEKELLLVSNMMRIVTPAGKNISYDWAEPQHPGTDDVNSGRGGWSEYDDWLITRCLAMEKAREGGNSDWIFATDKLGKRITLD
jgi:hypothetical protein